MTELREKWSSVSHNIHWDSSSYTFRFRALCFAFRFTVLTRLAAAVRVNARKKRDKMEVRRRLGVQMNRQ